MIQQPQRQAECSAGHFSSLSGSMRGKSRLLQPFCRQIYAAGARVFDNVARDVGELEGNAEVAGPVQHMLFSRTPMIIDIMTPTTPAT